MNLELFQMTLKGQWPSWPGCKHPERDELGQQELHASKQPSLASLWRCMMDDRWGWLPENLKEKQCIRLEIKKNFFASVTMINISFDSPSPPKKQKNPLEL